MDRWAGLYLVKTRARPSVQWGSVEAAGLGPDADDIRRASLLRVLVKTGIQLPWIRRQEKTHDCDYNEGY